MGKRTKSRNSLGVSLGCCFIESLPQCRFMKPHLNVTMKEWAICLFHMSSVSSLSLPACNPCLTPLWFPIGIGSTGHWTELVTFPDHFYPEVLTGKVGRGRRQSSVSVGGWSARHHPGSCAEVTGFHLPHQTFGPKRVLSMLLRATTKDQLNKSLSEQISPCIKQAFRWAPLSPIFS